MKRTLILAAAVALASRPGDAYITAPVQTLGQLCGWSTYITLVRVEKVSKEKGIIVYKKVRDLKGVYPRDQIRHAFDLKNTPLHKGSGDVPVRPDEVDWKYAVSWAEAGKTAVVVSLKYDPYGDFGHTYIDKCWYATMCPARDWDFWWAIYSDPALLTRWHCGTPEQLAAAIEQVLAGKTATVPTLAQGNRDEFRQGRGKIQGLKVSLAIGDFNAARDRVANWPPRELPAILKDLDHADSDVRLAALEALAGAEPEHAKIVPGLIPFLKDPQPQRRLQAAEILTQTPARTKSAGAADLGAVATALLEQPDTRVRAATVLVRLGPEAGPAVASLAKALKDPDRAVRILAAEALGAIGPDAKAAVPALGDAVRSDASGTVRMRCADALARIGPHAKPARPALEAALQDPAMAARPEVLEKIREVHGRLK
jgi:HEAT repeat protein